MIRRSLHPIQRHPPINVTQSAVTDVDTDAIVQEVLDQLPPTSHTHDNLPLLDSLSSTGDVLIINDKPVPGLLIFNDC